MNIKDFKPGDDVIVTQLWYWGRKTVIWRGTFVEYLPDDDAFIVHTDEGDMSFVNASIQKADVAKTRSLTD